MELKQTNKQTQNTTGWDKGNRTVGFSSSLYFNKPPKLDLALGYVLGLRNPDPKDPACPIANSDLRNQVKPLGFSSFTLYWSLCRILLPSLHTGILESPAQISPPLESLS